MRQTSKLLSMGPKTGAMAAFVTLYDMPTMPTNFHYFLLLFVNVLFLSVLFVNAFKSINNYQEQCQRTENTPTLDKRKSRPIPLSYKIPQ